MFAVMFCLLLQGQSQFDANAYYDEQYKVQCDKARKAIESIRSNPRTNNQSNINSATAKYNNIKLNYNIDLPDFEFSKGVKVGDVASFGFDKSRGGRIPTGTGGTIQTYNQVMLLTKVSNINNDSFETNLKGYGRTIIKGMDKSQLIDEKMIGVSNYLFRFDSKNENIKVYTVVATPTDFAKWKKLRMGKK